jgi:hypothetical protein
MNTTPANGGGTINVQSAGSPVTAALVWAFYPQASLAYMETFGTLPGVWPSNLT